MAPRGGAIDDVDRLFHHLVDVLATREPDLLHQPIEVTELYQRILPYRVHRTALRFDSNQDYEMAMLRLLAGEHGFAETEPFEAGERLAAEARSVNPDPRLFVEYGGATVRLNFRAVRDVLESRGAYAPPPASPRTPTPAPPGQQQRQPQAHPLELDLRSRRPAPDSGRSAPGGARSAAGPQPPTPAACPHCEAALPGGRPVVFCPFCGGNVHERTCPHCGTQLESNWRHCIACGLRVE